MRIALRPSGGRGDYELAGSYNSLQASDLLEKNFLFQITPSLLIDGKSKAHRLSGKPRIRPEGGKHPYVLIAAILILPPPRRELLRTPTTLTQLKVREYTLAGIDVDVLMNESNRVLFIPKYVWAKSRGGLLKVDFTDRMATIASLWSAAEITRSGLSKLLLSHKASVTSGDHESIVSSASALQKYYRTDGDIIPLILRDLSLSVVEVTDYSGVSDSSEGFDSEDDLTEPEESRRERTQKWRKQVDRGPGGREFGVLVKEAYDYRCIFSGERFPRLDVLDSSGVDGAHILPWSTHQLNSINNGLCLCKLCHWAFDNGLFRLDFDKVQSAYLLSIPKDVEAAAKKDNFDLTLFQKNIGIIDPARFPKNRKLWPSAEHIEKLNASVG